MLVDQTQAHVLRDTWPPASASCNFAEEDLPWEDRRDYVLAKELSCQFPNSVRYIEAVRSAIIFALNSDSTWHRPASPNASALD